MSYLMYVLKVRHGLPGGLCTVCSAHRSSCVGLIKSRFCVSYLMTSFKVLLLLVTILNRSWALDLNTFLFVAYLPWVTSIFASRSVALCEPGPTSRRLAVLSYLPVSYLLAMSWVSNIVPWCRHILGYLPVPICWVVLMMCEVSSFSLLTVLLWRDFMCAVLLMFS